MIELRSGASVARIDPDRGGRLASLCVGGRELLVGPPDPTDRTILWGSFLMAPWCGRVENAVLDWRGRSYELPSTMEGNAIHGTTWGQAWTVESTVDGGVTLTVRLEPGGWPFAGLVRQRFMLGERELVTSAEIEAEEAMPAALGWHPWFGRGDGDARITVNAGHTLETRALIPTGRRLPVDTETDLRDGPAIGSRLLDHCYVNARGPARATWPERVLEIAFDDPLTSVVVHTRAESFCIEPQTAWPNAVALEAAGIGDTGLVTLEAGERLAATTTWRWRSP